MARRIREGSQGEWGATPMPPNALSEEAALQLAQWILSLAPAP
jgi:cytochrome c